MLIKVMQSYSEHVDQATKLDIIIGLTKLFIDVIQPLAVFFICMMLVEFTYSIVAAD